MARGMLMAMGVLAAVGAGVLAAGVRGGTETGAGMGGPMTVHEWGTFTNFSTSDGVQRKFGSPVGAAAGLPGFVVGFKPGGQPGEQEPVSGWKEVQVCAQRMETPVIYIYPGCVEKADVEARILDGQMTEFYPPLNGAVAGKVDPAVVRWEGIKLQNGEMTKLPEKKAGVKGSHYFEARETDAAVLGVQAMGAMHYEKFLFYRGAADFESRMKVRALGGDRFEVSNATGEKIPAAFVMQVEERGAGMVRWAALGEVGAKKEGALPKTGSSPEALVEALRAELVKAGLYEKEASAMVATWKAYWFDEPGTRVLAIWPRGEVDRVLPLKVTPTPLKTERVFVGRMDVVTPEVEGQIAGALKAMDGLKEGSQAEAAWKGMPKLGRFLGPAVRGVAEKSRDAKMTVAAERAGW